VKLTIIGVIVAVLGLAAIMAWLVFEDVHWDDHRWGISKPLDCDND
jgi:hypothetical protein